MLRVMLRRAAARAARRRRQSTKPPTRRQQSTKPPTRRQSVAPQLAVLEDDFLEQQTYYQPTATEAIQHQVEMIDEEEQEMANATASLILYNAALFAPSGFRDFFFETNNHY